MKKTLLASLMILLIAAACGSQAATTPAPTQKALPTYAYTVPTVIITLVPATAEATQAATAEQVAADPTDLAHGQNRYTALACDTCHGADGKGTSKGPALVPMTLSEADFLTMLRTGGSLGNAHLFASNRLSDDFAHYLYEYLKSLPS